MMLQKILLHLYLPDFIKKRKLQELFALTAEAFQCETPSLKGLSFGDSLKQYALFTKEQAENHLRQEIDPLCGNDPTGKKNPADLKNRLYQNAFQYGLNLRRKLKCKTPEEFIAVCRLVYKIIGIDFHGNAQGKIEINRCFFSDYYSGDVCRLISSLDEGLIAGLSGGGQLEFSARITEGGICCKAFLDLRKG